MYIIYNYTPILHTPSRLHGMKAALSVNFFWIICSVTNTDPLSTCIFKVPSFQLSTCGVDWMKALGKVRPELWPKVKNVAWIVVRHGLSSHLRSSSDHVCLSYNNFLISDEMAKLVTMLQQPRTSLFNYKMYGMPDWLKNCSERPVLICVHVHEMWCKGLLLMSPGALSVASICYAYGQNLYQFVQKRQNQTLQSLMEIQQCQQNLTDKHFVCFGKGSKFDIMPSTHQLIKTHRLNNFQ